MNFKQFVLFTGSAIVIIVIVAYWSNDAEGDVDIARAEVMEQAWNDEQEINYLQVVHDYALPFVEAEEVYAAADVDRHMFILNSGYDPEGDPVQFWAIQGQWSKKKWQEYSGLLSAAYTAIEVAREKERALAHALCSRGYDRTAMHAWLAKVESEHGNPRMYVTGRIATLRTTIEN